MRNTRNARFRERSTIKVFELPDPWRKNPEVKLQTWDGTGEGVDKNSIMKVAQRGPINRCSYLGLKLKKFRNIS